MAPAGPPLRARAPVTVAVGAAPTVPEPEGWADDWTRVPELPVLEQVFRRMDARVAPAGARSGVVRCPRCRRRNRVPAAGSGVPVCGRCRHGLPWIAAAGDDDFTAVAEQATPPVVVGLWAPWCGLSWATRIALERAALSRAGQVKLVEVDVAVAPRQARRFVVRTVPTLLVLRSGRPVARRHGAPSAPELRDWLDETVGPEPRR
jgi:thioredoxin 2